MEVPDKSWMNLRRDDPKYEEGVDKFIEFAMSNTTRQTMKCPCEKCLNATFQDMVDLKTHLIIYGINLNYEFWYYHGEKRLTANVVYEDDDDCELDDGVPELNDTRTEFNNTINEEVDEDVNEEHYMQDFVHDMFPNVNDAGPSNHEPPVEDSLRFYKLLDDSKRPLYEGARITKSSALLKLLHIKNVCQWTHASFDMLLRLLKDEILPADANLPNSYYESKKFITDIGLKYEKIDACNNNCMLFWKDDTSLESCRVCGLSRWKVDQTSGRVRKKQNGKFMPTKVLRYFPLIPRLQRLYMCSKTAPMMRWHKEGRIESDMLRHPADSLTWKTFDERYEDFASDSRSVRLGLSSDGFQPFANAKKSYSVWPVILVPYNVSPTTCMDSSNFILTMLIPGPKSPGDAIDIFLQPLIEELIQLWHTGVRTFDAHTSQYFNMRAALLWTINDFPAYANLSGWSTKGKLACPCCNNDTISIRLSNCQKQCYMGHRRFLPSNHKYRRDKKSFDGRTDYREPRRQLTGQEMYEQARDLENTVLTADQRRKTKIYHETRGDNWNKLSIFFRLPYWSSLLLRHNLDVMHIEKNICDSVLGTMMNVKEKTKDGPKARKDLQLLDIKHWLHPVNVGGAIQYPEAPFTLSSDNKKRLCKFLKDLRLPDGFCSNIGGCVNLDEKKITGLKSHDCHILLEYLIPLATRGLLPDHVYDAIVNLSRFFRLLCSKELITADLEQLYLDIITTLCKLEMIFPPSLFDIMMHLPVHLSFEALLGGPVQYRWMYPIEQYMGTMKRYLRNKNHPEASISESYLVNESISLCARYLEEEDQERAQNSISGLSIFSSHEELSNGKIYNFDYCDRETAHSYILKNCPEAEHFYM